MGSSDELIVTDGSETLYIQDAGIYTFGPYNSGQEVTISFDTGDFNCDSTVVFAYTCPPIGSTGDEPILINSLPYYTQMIQSTMEMTIQIQQLVVMEVAVI